MKVYSDKYIAELLDKTGFKIIKKFENKFTKVIIADRKSVV